MRVRIPNDLPWVGIVDLTRADARALLDCLPDQKKRADVGGSLSFVDRLARDMEPPDGAATRWRLSNDAIWLLAEPGADLHDQGGVLANGRDRLDAFLSTTRRKLTMLLLVDNVADVTLNDALLVTDQGQRMGWQAFCRVQGVTNASQIAGVIRHLHLLAVRDDDCLHARKGGYSNAERWAFWQTQVDHDLANDCRAACYPLALENCIPLHQMTALLYRATQEGHRDECMRYLGHTLTSQGLSNPGRQVAAYAGALHRVTPYPHELLTWHALIVGWHAHLQGKGIATQSQLAWSNGDELLPTMPADLPATKRSKAAASA